MKKIQDSEIQPNFLRPTFFEVLFYVANHRTYEKVSSITLFKRKYDFVINEG